MIYYMTRFGQRLAGIIPQNVRWALGGFFAQCAYWGWTSKRRATIFNYAVVLGLPASHPQVRRAARLSWRNYGRFLADFFDLPNHPASFFLEQITDVSEGGHTALETVAQARARGRGVLLISAHFGNWDYAGMLVASQAPLWILIEHLKDERLNSMVQEQRRGVGMHLLPIQDALRPMMRILREGGTLATPIDRPMPPGEGVPVRFFGRTTFVPRALGALAVKLGSAMVPGFVWYDWHGGYYVRAFPAMTIEPSGDDTADVIAATQAMFDALEIIVRLDPTQWFMFRQFWPDDATLAAYEAARASERSPAAVRPKGQP